MRLLHSLWVVPWTILLLITLHSDGFSLIIVFLLVFVLVNCRSSKDAVRGRYHSWLSFWVRLLRVCVTEDLKPTRTWKWTLNILCRLLRLRLWWQLLPWWSAHLFHLVRISLWLLIEILGSSINSWASCASLIKRFRFCHRTQLRISISSRSHCSKTGLLILKIVIRNLIRIIHSSLLAGSR
jgi:hypothetical protein